MRNSTIRRITAKVLVALRSMNDGRVSWQKERKVEIEDEKKIPGTGIELFPVKYSNMTMILQQIRGAKKPIHLFGELRKRAAALPTPPQSRWYTYLLFKRVCELQ